jgi:hypothetical protein
MIWLFLVVEDLQTKLVLLSVSDEKNSPSSTITALPVKHVPKNCVESVTLPLNVLLRLMCKQTKSDVGTL